MLEYPWNIELKIGFPERAGIVRIVLEKLWGKSSAYITYTNVMSLFDVGVPWKESLESKTGPRKVRKNKWDVKN